MQSIATRADISEEELVDLVTDSIPDNSNVISYLYGARTVELVVRMDRYEYRRMQVRTTINTTGTLVNK